jgi:hypothetical protein
LLAVLLLWPASDFSPVRRWRINPRRQATPRAAHLFDMNAGLILSNGRSAGKAKTVLMLN